MKKMCDVGYHKCVCLLYWLPWFIRIAHPGDTYLLVFYNASSLPCSDILHWSYCSQNQSPCLSDSHRGHRFCDPTNLSDTASQSCEYTHNLFNDETVGRTIRSLTQMWKTVLFLAVKTKVVVGTVAGITTRWAQLPGACWLMLTWI